MIARMIEMWLEIKKDHYSTISSQIALEFIELEVYKP